MDKITSFVETHKTQVGLAVLGSSIIAYFFLKQNPLKYSHVLVTSSKQGLEYGQNFFKNLSNGKFNSEDEANVLGNIHIVQDNQVKKIATQLAQEPYIRVDFLTSLLRKSKINMPFDLLYSTRTTSTQTLTYNYLEDYNKPLIYVADTQTKGRGRGNNSWDSPKGSLLMTFTYAIKTEFLVVLQYVISLSIHEAILNKTGEEFILKWPNDTYYKAHKVAGTIIQATDMKDDPEYKKVFIGFGIDMDNSEPTISINSILLKNNKEKIAAEELIILILEKFEENLKILETKSWENGLAEKYYQYWEDYNQEVTLIRDEGSSEEKVQIKGLDTMGNLSLLTSEGGKTTINPNFYSYDLIRKIIHKKK